MTIIALNQFLALFSWFVLAALMLFLLLIARFYEKFSGEPMYFRLFVAPLALFSVATVRYADLNRITQDALADTAMIIGGVMLIGLSVWMFWRMIYRKDNPS